MVECPILVKQDIMVDKDDGSYLSSLLHLKNDSGILGRLTDVLSVLSKEDGLTIFLSTKNGLVSELDTPQKIGLTKKQYYTRIKQLFDLGLVTKTGDQYVHTALGNIVYQKHILSLVNSIALSKEFEMIDALRQTSKFGNDEIMNFVAKLSPEKDVYGLVGAASAFFSVASTFDDMVRKVLELVEFAEKEILLVTRFPNELIINAILKRFDMGIQTRIITDIHMAEQYFKSEKDKIGINDKNKTERVNVVANPFYPSRIERRYAKTPFCMMIVDGAKIGLEIVNNYEPERFKTAIFGNDENLCTEMKRQFDNLWKIASVNPPQIKSVKG